MHDEGGGTADAFKEPHDAGTWPLRRAEAVRKEA